MSGELGGEVYSVRCRGTACAGPVLQMNAFPQTHMGLMGPMRLMWPISPISPIRATLLTTENPLTLELRLL